MMTQETDSQVVALDTTRHIQPLSVIYTVIIQSNEAQLIMIIIIMQRLSALSLSILTVAC